MAGRFGEAAHTEGTSTGGLPARTAVAVLHTLLDHGSDHASTLESPVTVRPESSQFAESKVAPTHKRSTPALLLRCVWRRTIAVPLAQNMVPHLPTCVDPTACAVRLTPRPVPVPVNCRVKHVEAPLLAQWQLRMSSFISVPVHRKEFATTQARLLPNHGAKSHDPVHRLLARHAIQQPSLFNDYNNHTLDTVRPTAALRCDTKAHQNAARGCAKKRGDVSSAPRHCLALCWSP